jgi:hypothetical protein
MMLSNAIIRNSPWRVGSVLSPTLRTKFSVRNRYRDEIGHGDHFQPVKFAELHEVRNARHRSVVAHDFADHGSRRQPGNAGQIHGSFGLAGANQDSPVSRAKREDVARACEIAGSGVGVYRPENGGCAVLGGDSSGNAEPRLDRHAESRAIGCGIAVIRYHQRNIEIVQALPGHGKADQSTAVRCHEVDGFGRDFFGGDHEVALVFTVLIIDDDDHPPFPNLD